MTLEEMQSHASAPSFDALLHQLALGEMQKAVPPHLIKVLPISLWTISLQRQQQSVGFALAWAL